MIGTFQALLNFIRVDGQRFDLTQEDQVVSLAVQVVAPDGAVGKNLEERGDLALYYVHVGFVEGHPLGDQSPRVEMALAKFEVFLRIQRGGSLDPGMNRIGGDNVELVVRR